MLPKVSARRLDSNAISFDGVVNRSAFSASTKLPLLIASFTDGRIGVSITSSAGSCKSFALIISRSANSSGVSLDRASATLSVAL